MSDLLDQLAAYGRSHEERQAAAAVVPVLDRHPDVDVIELRPEDPGGSSMRGRVGILMGALAAAAIVVAVLLVAGGDEESSDTRTADWPLEIAVLGEFVDALNAGEIETAITYLGGESAAETAAFLRVAGVGTLPANPRDEVAGPCEIDGAAGGATIAVCPFEGNDDFRDRALGPAATTWTVEIEDDLITSWVVQGSPEADREGVEYIRAFWRWLQQEHRDVFATIEPLSFNDLPGYHGDSEQMRIALEYVDEFVEQSEDYPLPGRDG